MTASPHTNQCWLGFNIISENTQACIFNWNDYNDHHHSYMDFTLKERRFFQWLMNQSFLYNSCVCPIKKQYMTLLETHPKLISHEIALPNLTYSILSTVHITVQRAVNTQHVVWYIVVNTKCTLHSLAWKLLYFDLEVCSLGSIWQYVSIGSENGVAPNRLLAQITDE